MKIEEKYNLKQLTPEQLKKINKVIKLLEDLKKENVNAVLVSSPDNSLHFYAADHWADSYDDFVKLLNYTDFVFEPKQSHGLIDAFGL